MVRYLRVNEKPQSLEKNEMTVVTPDYKDSITGAKFFIQKKGLITTSLLRSILGEIVLEKDPNFNVFRDFNLSRYEGIPYRDFNDLSNLIVGIIQEQQPQFIKEDIADQLQNIPDDIDLIYFVAKDLKNADVFTKLKITMATSKKDKAGKKE